MTGRGQPSAPRFGDYMVGTTGPAVVVPAHVAYWLAADVGRMVDAKCTQLGSSQPTLQGEMRALVVALRVSAEEYAKAVRSAGGAPSGHLVEPGADGAHDDATNGWLSTVQASQRCGLTPRQLRRLAVERRLPAQRVGRDWRIDPAGLVAYQEQRTA